MYSDTHLHTCFSSDSDTPVKDQIQRAISLGMPAICITDHMDIDFPEEVYGMSFQFDVTEYLKTLKAYQEEYKSQIEIRIGIELGLKDDISEKLISCASNPDFDYVIGSIHLVRNMDPYYDEFYQGRSTKEAYLEYFETTLKNVSMHNCFDSLGHLDYVVRYGPDAGQDYPSSAFDDVIDEILKEIIAKGIALECNTAGLKYGLGFPNPHERVIRRYLELGGEMVTLGSDGHMPIHLGYAFHDIGAYLKDCGLKRITEFRKRKPFFTDL